LMPFTRRLLRAELKRAGVIYEGLAKRLKKHSPEETESSTARASSLNPESGGIPKEGEL
jgi:hypothetical protein